MFGLFRSHIAGNLCAASWTFGNRIYAAKKQLACDEMLMLVHPWIGR